MTYEFNIYDILASKKDDTTGTITCQLGDAVAGERLIDDAEVWGPIGLAARPSDVQANATDAAQAISLSRSDGDIVFATRDVRGQSIYGNLGPGDTCLYSSGSDGTGQARMYLKGDSSINIFTREDKDADGMGIYIDPSSDTIRITNAAGYGLLIDEDGFTLLGPGGSIQIVDKIKIASSSTLNLDAPTINIGMILPPGPQCTQVNINAQPGGIKLGGQTAALPVARVTDIVQAGPFSGTITASTNIKTLG